MGAGGEIIGNWLDCVGNVEGGGFWLAGGLAEVGWKNVAIGAIIW